MGWGVTVDGIYLSRMYTSELESRYEDNEQMIITLHKRILLLAAGTPREVALDSESVLAWEDYIREEIDSAMEAIQEAAGQNFVIGQILANHTEVTATNT
jgi:hypothetical protein